MPFPFFGGLTAAQSRQLTDTAASVATIKADTAAIKKTLAAMQALEIKMAATLDDVLADVTNETTAIDSVAALIQGLRDQIAAGGLSAADQAKVDAIFAAAETNKGKIAAALAANVPPAGGASKA